MRETALIIFLVFSALYIFTGYSIYYHLKQYLLPNAKSPQAAIYIFLIVSAIVWVFTLINLFFIPS